MAGPEGLISDLIAIESVNPDLVPGGAGEGAIASFVGSWLADAGLEVSMSSRFQAGRRWWGCCAVRAAGAL